MLSWLAYFSSFFSQKKKKKNEREKFSRHLMGLDIPKRSSMQQKSIASSVTISFANETPSFVSLAGEEESSFFFSFRLPI